MTVFNNTLDPNDPGVKSWVDVPESSDFPIQNLPFGIFRTDTKKPRVGVAIGDSVLDLSVLFKKGYFLDLPLPEKNVFRRSTLNRFIGLTKTTTSAVRKRVAYLLSEDVSDLRDNKNTRAKALLPMSEVKMMMPLNVRNYTDFYSSIEHATNVGSMFRDPDNALLPNWKHLPVGYHGRTSSIILSGEDVIRPSGQTKAPGQDKPSFGPSRKMDFELEMAFVVSKGTNRGEPVSASEAPEHIFGFVLFNDWSARDIQAWEYVPLGPFLGKNFASSISPWVVTLDALKPFRVPGPVQDPEVLDYLKTSGDWNFDIGLEVAIGAGGTETVVCRSNFKHMYWNICQQLAHHTINGCNIETGDLYASGTISGPEKESFGSMLELSWNGKNPLTLSDGTERTFLLDEDTVIMRGAAKRDGIRVGFGEVSNKLVGG